MVDLKKLQKCVYKNKLKKGFNTTSVEKDFCLLQVEVGEAVVAYFKKLPDLGEELADVTIYLLGIAEMLDIDLEKELTKKIAKNERRQYKKIKGVFVRTKEG